MKKIFKNFQSAVSAISECCRDDAGFGSPIAESEVYNETWMLRMILALIHDYEGTFLCKCMKKGSALNQIRETVRRKWISEGGLEPAFENEGTTWTDAILGDIKFRDESDRGVVVNPNENEPVGIVIVEAKMGSNISPDISNSKDYNQVARNIACLAKLTMNYEYLYKRLRMVVFVPDGWWNRHHKSKPNNQYPNPGALLLDSLRIIQHQRRKKKAITNEQQFEKAIKSIISNSVFITWDEILRSIDDRNVKVIKEFYMHAKSGISTEVWDMSGSGRACRGAPVGRDKRGYSR